MVGISWVAPFLFPRVVSCVSFDFHSMFSRVQLEGVAKKEKERKKEK